MMEEYDDDFANDNVTPAMETSGNKKVRSYANSVQAWTEEDWKEICWLEEHVANIS